MKKGVLFLYNKYMKNLTIINPYDDDNLIYNKESGRYELTPQYCKDNFETTFKDDNTLKRRIKRNSQVCYNFIRLHGALVNRPIINFFLNKTQEGRDFLLEILAAQMYADIETGYNDLMFQPAINFNGQDKDRNAIRQNMLCVAAEEIYEASDDYFGIRISYQGQFPYQYFLYAKANGGNF